MKRPAFSQYASPAELAEYERATPDAQLAQRKLWAVRWGAQYVREFGGRPVYGPRGAFLREHGLVDEAVRMAAQPCPCPNNHGPTWPEVQAMAKRAMASR